MVRKLKVVDVAPAQEAQPIEEIKPPQEEEVDPPQVEEVKPSHEEESKPDEPAHVEEVVEAKPDKKKKPIEEVVCSNCNEKMLMKTYKYSHQKICKPDIQEIPSKEVKPTPPAQPKLPAPPKQLTAQADIAVTFDAHSQLNQ